MNKREPLFHTLRRWVSAGMMAALAMPLVAQQEQPAQTDAATDSLAAFVRNIVAYNKMYPREQVYLHFDNTGYFMGETIWFKGYVVNPAGNHSTDMSRVLYVELLTPEGRVLQTHKLKVENGQCCGQLSLATLLHAGYYEVRACTAMMLNWEDAPVFSRVFPVFNAPTKEGKGMYDHPRMVGRSSTEKLPEYRPKAEKSAKLNLRFFPEGGDLVNGLPGNVAFKATDKQGNAVEVAGRIYNSRREEVGTLVTQHEGMGRFLFTPESGETYTAEVEQQGRVQRFSLPTAQTEGVAMNVNNLRPDQVLVQLSRSAGVPADKAFGLTVMAQGRVLLFRRIEWNGETTAMISLPKDRMPAGVNQLTLFDTDGNIHAERLVFVPLKGKAEIACTSLKESYRPKEKVELNFKVTDETGQPLPTCFSLSVRDADTDTPVNGNHAGGIMANLLLGSEVKGYIHNIDYYFEADDRTHTTALDLLLCTQGWRRYDWKQMTRPQEFTVTHPIEEGILIRGDLTSTFRNRAKEGAKIKVSLYNASGETRVGSCLSDEEGKFAFLADDFYGRWEMHIATFEQKSEKMKQKEMNVNLDKVKGPQPRRYAAGETELYIVQEAGAQSIKPDSVVSYDEEEKQRWENLLPSVEIEAQKPWQSDFVRRWNNLIYDMEDERMRMDETGEDYLKEFYRWLEETNRYFTFSTDTAGNLEATYKNRPVSFYVTRVNTTGANWLVKDNISINVEDLTINDVEAIAISDKPNVELAINASSMGMDPDSISNSRSVVVSVYVREDYFRYKDGKGQRRSKVQGYTHERQFYLPDYSYADLPDERDFRRTLYWEPYVNTNADGEATVSFYNSPICRRLHLSAETVTGKGRIGQLSK